LEKPSADETRLKPVFFAKKRDSGFSREREMAYVKPMGAAEFGQSMIPKTCRLFR
jgi:hypothetical protein